MLASEISGPSCPLAFAKLLKNKSGLVITRTEAAASTYVQELKFYEPQLAGRLVYIPDSETLPFDLERAPAPIMAERAFALNRILKDNDSDLVVITSAANCMRIIANKDFWLNEQITINVGDNIGDRVIDGSLWGFLDKLGYKLVTNTKAVGQYATRGRIFDIHPVGLAFLGGDRFCCPVRIRTDINGCVESISKLDPLTQESAGVKFESLSIYSCREYPLSKVAVENYRKRSFTLHDDPRSLDSYKTISERKDHPELASWVGADGMQATTLIELVAPDQLLIEKDARLSLQAQWELVCARHLDIRDDLTRVCPPIEMSWASPNDILKLSEKINIKRFVGDVLPSGMVRKGCLPEALALLKEILSTGYKTLFVMSSDVRTRHIQMMCKMTGNKSEAIDSLEAFDNAPPGIYTARGTLINGYRVDPVYRVITESELFGGSIEASFDDEIGQHQRKAILQGLDEITPGQHLVHATEGIGYFDGFQTISVGDINEDMIRIRYAGEATSFVRIRDLDLVSRFSGPNAEKIKLSTLNDERWMRGLRESQASAFDAARKLIQTRNQRLLVSGLSLEPPGDAFHSFCEVFAHEETLDQKRSVNEILDDLSSGRPMDRLICGDVGFGKTEVALRAAFHMIDQGFQVAMLAPTTILAEQHYQTTVQRFENFPIKIILANRKSLSKEDLRVISSGEPCFVIGTHRILQRDISFDRLGLLIVDEEHRFGVSQKEKLRSLRANKHVLSMTATPIPRTLGMGIAGIRDISVLATAPARRLSIRTMVRGHSNAIIREAIGREIARGGQVFFVHNNIDTMGECASMLQEIYPDAKVGQVHGRMDENEMAGRLDDFHAKAYDILVCTTVIEVGIDVPNANTIIIDQAGNFGLAQLHQLRGRVGRSNRQAYCYLLTNEKTGSQGFRRLAAMENNSNLGEGILLARQDMEIRGIGEILGEEQSGHIHSIGFGLYMRLLSQAIKTLDNNPDAKEAQLMIGNVSMPLDGEIPPSFISNTGTRLAWYQRLMSSDTAEELKTHLQALEDMYGFIPDEVERFGRHVVHHITLRGLGIESVRIEGDQIRLEIGNGGSVTQVRMLLNKELRGRLQVLGDENAILVKNSTIEAVAEILSKIG